MSKEENRQQTTHDLKKMIRRLKLIFDELESNDENSTKEEISQKKDDFENDLKKINVLWGEYKKMF